jgi:non-specific serine/threonine protein kinase
MLPTPLTSFIGRTREIADIVVLLGRDDVRLVALTGPGGVGKTRTALAVLREVAPRFRDGARFVGLAPVADPELVASTIAQALAAPEGGVGPIEERLAAFLRDQHMLLVLDNVEQVVEAAPLVARLLAACPELRVLATSRVPLRVSGEREYPLAPFGVLGADERASLDAIARSDAARLFVERAQAVAPGFELSAENAPVVAEICRRLDGLPLAIELAAARVKVLPPAALLARLGQRLPLLTGGARDLPERQRTLRDTIAWSYDLLPPAEQALFRRLAVFVGGFGLDAAEAVCGGWRMGNGGWDGSEYPTPIPDHLSPIDGIASLVDKSLLRQEAGPGMEPRYGMLETIREFGLERLAESGDEETTRRAHADWCIALAEWAWRRSSGGRRWSIPAAEPESMRRIEADDHNLRAALAWLERAGESADLLRLAVALWGFWFLRGQRREIRAWLEGALDAARARGDQSPARARAMIGAGLLARNQGAYARAAALANEYLEIARHAGEPWREDEARWLLGYVALAEGDYDVATAQLERALALLDASFDPLNAADAGSMLGMAAYGAGDLARAAALQEEVLGVFRELDDPFREVLSLGYLGLIACARGDLRGSAARFAAALRLLRELGGRETLAEWLAGVAELAVAAGAPEQAARFVGASEALRERLGHAFTLPERAAYERGGAAARAALGDAAFAAAEAAGRALPIEEAVAEAEAYLASITAWAAAESREAGSAPVHGLTPREIDVVRLIASGKSNAEIAEALYLSIPTVKRHLTNILGKLDLPSRSALNTWAHHQDLAEPARGYD